MRQSSVIPGRNIQQICKKKPGKDKNQTKKKTNKQTKIQSIQSKAIETKGERINRIYERTWILWAQKEAV